MYQELRLPREIQQNPRQWKKIRHTNWSNTINTIKRLWEHRKRNALLFLEMSGKLKSWHYGLNCSPELPVIYIQLLTCLISISNLSWPKQSDWFPNIPQSDPLLSLSHTSKWYDHLTRYSRKKTTSNYHCIWTSNANFIFTVYTFFFFVVCG